MYRGLVVKRNIIPSSHILYGDLHSPRVPLTKKKNRLDNKATENKSTKDRKAIPSFMENLLTKIPNDLLSNLGEKL